MSLNDMASVPPINNTVNRMITTVDESMMLQLGLGDISNFTIFNRYIAVSIQIDIEFLK